MVKTNTNPEVRFAGFSEDWVPSKLGNIGEVKMCKRIFNNQTSPKGDIPFYKIGTFGKKADSYISKELYQEFRNKYPFPKEGDILISASGTLGRIVVYDGKPAYFQDSNIVWLNHNESKILNEFLYYIYGNITYESEGGTIQRLYNSIILNARFSFPESKDEQKLIGNFFENIDNLITEHQHKHSKLKSLKHAMLDKMFPKQGQLVPDIRFKGFEGEWENLSLGKIGDPYTGLSGKTKKDFGHGDGRYITYMNVFSNPISDINEIEKIEIDSSQNEVIAGDVLFTVSSETAPEVGLSSVWTGNQKNVYLNSFCFGYRPKIKLDNCFLANLLRTQTFRKQMTLLAQGISRYNISKNKVMNLTISLPKYDEQVVIGVYFKNLDSLINQHNEQITKLGNLKKALLAKMFI
jgi:type I restriction enzyme, S subunit